MAGKLLRTVNYGTAGQGWKRGVGGMVTVSNPSKTNGSAVTHKVDRHVNFLRISSNSLCHVVALVTLGTNVSYRSGSTIMGFAGSIAPSFIMGNGTVITVISNGRPNSTVHATRVGGTMDPISGIPRIHAHVAR